MKNIKDAEVITKKITYSESKRKGTDLKHKKWSINISQRMIEHLGAESIGSYVNITLNKDGSMLIQLADKE